MTAPPWLTLTEISSTEYTITGTPNVNGTFAISFHVTSVRGTLTAYYNCTVHISGYWAPTITSTSFIS